MKEPRIGRWAGLGLKIGLIAVLSTLAFLYWSYVQYRVTPVTEGAFYHSSAMPPERLQEVVQDRGIKTVIDFRFQTAKTAEGRRPWKRSG